MALPPRFDPYDPEVLDNPYPTYARLREAAPVCRGGPAQWVVTRYTDIASLIGDPRLGSQYGYDYHRLATGEGPLAAFFERIILNRDPPEHSRLRRLLGQAFTPARVRERSGGVGELVDELLAPALDRGRLDAVTDLASLLPFLVLADFVGIPRDDLDAVQPRAITLSRAFATFLPPPERAAAREAVEWLRHHVATLLRARRRAPRDDLLSRLLAPEEGLSQDEMVDNLVFLLFAGFSTTTDLLATACAALLAHPDQLARLRADPSLIPTAIEEFLRFDAPVQVKSRVALEPIEIGGRSIRRGRIVVLLLGSANHDPCQFRHPELLDVGRRPNPHLSFGGGGIHHCIGAALARMEAAAVLGRLVRRCSVLEPDGLPVRRPSASFRSYASVPMRIEPSVVKVSERG